MHTGKKAWRLQVILLAVIGSVSREFSAEWCNGLGSVGAELSDEPESFIHPELTGLSSRVAAGTR